jgi:hypothetical protein
MSDTVFVTSLYHYSPHSRIGGRGWGLEHWAGPARNLIALDTPLIIYTHEPQASKLEEFFKKYKFDKYEIILHDLETYRLSDKIYSLKEQSGIIDKDGLTGGNHYNTNVRNHHLCLQKINWLNDHAEKRTFSGSKYFWIDFGLFHHGLFPDSLGGAEKLQPIKDKNFWPMNQISMFRPDLARGIHNVCGDKFLCIKHMNEPVNVNILELAGLTDIENLGYVIGGLFGGSPDMISFFNNEFNIIADQAYEKDILTLEELLLSTLYSKYSSKCNVMEFENWYHDCPGGPEVDRCCYGVPDDVYSFYKIFYNKFLGNE